MFPHCYKRLRPEKFTSKLRIIIPTFSFQRDKLEENVSVDSKQYPATPKHNYLLLFFEEVAMHAEEFL